MLTRAVPLLTYLSTHKEIRADTQLGLQSHGRQNASSLPAVEELMAQQKIATGQRCALTTIS